MPRRTTPWLRYSLIVNLALMAALAAWVLGQAFPSSEAVRLRNALLFDVGSTADFNWTPESLPAGYMAERRPPTPRYLAAARAVAGDSAGADWPRALAFAGLLARNARDLGPIQSDLAATYRGIVEEGRGYCADFIYAYLGLAHAAGLTAREWAFSFDGFGGHGHAFVEVYARQRAKWLFLDVYNNVHALDSAGEPLGALEFRDAVLGRRPAAVIRANGPGRPGFAIEAKLLDYYRRGAAEWYLWWGNSVFTYDAHPGVRAAGAVSLALGQLVAIAAGVHPRIKAFATPENAPQRERMLQLRRALLSVAAVVAGQLLVLAAQLMLMRRRDAGGLEHQHA